MTVFKTFLKVLNKYKGTILLYTILLIGFAGFNMKTNNVNESFQVTKPDILLINQDENIGITESLMEYLNNTCKVREIEEGKEEDALFYRDISTIIYIPKDFRKDFLDEKKLTLEIKQTGDYESSLTKMLLDRFLKTATIYQTTKLSEEEIIEKTNETLKKETEIEVTSTLDTTGLSKASFYFNFLNYTLLAGSVYVICLILSSFRKEQVNKRTIISSTNYKKYNRELLISNALFAIVMWFFYVILGFILVGNVLFTRQGVMMVINSFFFTLCSLTIAFLIANLIQNKNAINGIINVVALGTSFLCGAFVPMQYLPTSVVNLAHIFPSYWYIKSNDYLSTLEVMNLETLKPVFINISIVFLFTIFFVIAANQVYQKKRKVG